MPVNYILTLSCADRPGIVAAVATEIAAMGANISESNQFGDRGTGRFFMRIAFAMPGERPQDDVARAFKPVFDRFAMRTDLVDADRKPRIIVMVSRFDHAMLHLLYQIRVGWLRAEPVAIISNHEDAAAIGQLEPIPFHHWPVTKANKGEQEERLLTLVRETQADLVVLARYMQVLSDAVSTRLFGKVINIHHSFLPSFKGARPYHQAFERGVKLIGASSHYVTPELDEGPIIEQETERVTHAMSVEDLVATGRDIESRVLARAVKLHCERRVMLNGRKTVVFA